MRDRTREFGICEKVWIWYCVCVLAVVALFGASGGEWGGVYRPIVFAAIHVVILVAVFVVRRLCVADRSIRIARCALALTATPTVFMSLGLLLPGIHPEPHEFRWIAADRWLVGGDPTRTLQFLVTPWPTELLQWCYAVFYGIPIAVVIAVGLRRGADEFDRARDLMVFAFLASYLGYLWWPTLPPYHYLHHEVRIEGVWLAAELHARLELFELHRWNCFPSGHTMLSVISLVIAWRRARGAFWALLPIVTALLVSTVVLRYHYLVDVMAGLAGVPLALWLWRAVAADHDRKLGIPAAARA